MARASRMVNEIGFSQYTSLPLFTAMTDAVACQLSPVATTTASMSSRANRSRRSVYASQPR